MHRLDPHPVQHDRAVQNVAEWQKQLYINFVDYEKAFDSVHRESLWHIL